MSKRLYSYGKQRTDFYALARELSNRTEWHMGEMRGTAKVEWKWGRLDYSYRESVKRADYVVYSYSTPIAWHTPEGWVMPDVKYSPTTTTHQGKVSVALSVM